MSETQVLWIKEFIRKLEEQTLFLLADGFDDDPVLPLIIELRRVSKPIRLLGFSKKEVRSAQGILIQPDISLDEVSNRAQNSILIIPDGHQINSRIMNDPRVHHLAETILENKAYIIAVPQAALAIQQILAVDNDHLITWEYGRSL